MSTEEVLELQMRLAQAENRIAELEVNIDNLEVDVENTEVERDNMESERDDYKLQAMEYEQAFLAQESLADERGQRIEELDDLVETAQRDVEEMRQENDALMEAKERSDLRAEEYENTHVDKIRREAWEDAWEHIAHLLAAFNDILDMVQTEDGMRAMGHPGFAEVRENRDRAALELRQAIEAPWTHGMIKARAGLRLANRTRLRAMVWNLEREIFRGHVEFRRSWNHIRSQAGLTRLNEEEWDERIFLAESFQIEPKIKIEQGSIAQFDTTELGFPVDPNPSPDVELVKIPPIPDPDPAHLQLDHYDFTEKKP